MSAARLLGMERSEAARFSMLLSIPAILGAGTLKGLDLYRLGDVELTLTAVLAAGLAFVAAWATILALMAWLQRATFTPFVVYRVFLGARCWWPLPTVGSAERGRASTPQYPFSRSTTSNGGRPASMRRMFSATVAAAEPTTVQLAMCGVIRILGWAQNG